MPIKAEYYDQLSRYGRKLLREEYIKDQEGKCWYCKNLLGEAPSDKVQEAKIFDGIFPEGFFNYPIHLHHSRRTGLTIGAVHARCNAYLWIYLGQ